MRILLIIIIILSINAPALAIDYKYKFKLGKEIIQLETAETLKEKRTGLMYREKLAPNTGMVFLYDDYYEQSFWMKNVKIPLDIIFLRDKKIVKIYHKVKPCKEGYYCPIYYSGCPVNKVIELNGGFCQKHDIKESQELNLKKIK